MPRELVKFLWKRFGHVRSVRHFRDILDPYLSSGMCPPHSLAEILSGDEQKLWAFIWEALLYWHFSRLPEVSIVNDHIQKAGQIGPDFKLRHDETTVWVEATVPMPTGIPSDWLEPPIRGRIRAKTKPYDAVLLRWTAALKEKCDADPGVVSENGHMMPRPRQK